MVCVQMNRAVEELVNHAESNSKLIIAAKTRGSAITSEERDRAIGLLNKLTVSTSICVMRRSLMVQKHEGIHGSLFFLESDLKGGTHATLDKTGKSILTILRHLGKLTEVCSTDLILFMSDKYCSDADQH